jgi:hypothetical protein
MGNFHLTTGSQAINSGAASKSGIAAPATDIDNETRPFPPLTSGGAYDIGADEFH